MTTPQGMLELADIAVTKTEKRIEMIKLLQQLRLNDEMPGETILRALRQAAAPQGREVLREALEPFAKLAEFVSDNHRDTRPIVHGLAVSVFERLTIGHLRAAKSVLALTSAVAPDAGAGEALTKIASQMTSDELIEEHGEEFVGDFEEGYDAIIKIARAALSHNGTRKET